MEGLPSTLPKTNPSSNGLPPCHHSVVEASGTPAYTTRAPLLKVGGWVGASIWRLDWPRSLPAQGDGVGPLWDWDQVSPYGQASKVEG